MADNEILPTPATSFVEANHADVVEVELHYVTVTSRSDLQQLWELAKH